MKKYAGFRNGYVRVRIYGEQTERFLNLCRAREIRISDLRRESELSLTGCLQIRDFFRLAPIHRNKSKNSYSGKAWTSFLFLPK